MKKYYFKRNKYFLASAGLLLGSFGTNSVGLQLFSSGLFLYNFFEKTGIIEADYHPEMVHRRLALNE